MKLQIGSNVSGKVIACNREVSGLADRVCIIDVGRDLYDSQSTSRGYICHGDLFWSNHLEFGDPTYDKVVADVAQSLVGQVIDGVVLTADAKRILIGRKQLQPDPVLYFEEHRDLVFVGIIMETKKSYARVKIDFKNMGLDPYNWLEGVLPRCSCNAKIWKTLQVENTINLRVGLLDGENRAFIFVPEKWKNRYRRGIRFETGINISAKERALLTCYSTCRDCETLLQHNIADVFMSTGLGGEYAENMLAKCPSCEKYHDTKEIWQASAEYLEMLKKNAPELARRLIGEFK